MQLEGQLGILAALNVGYYLPGRYPSINKGEQQSGLFLFHSRSRVWV